MKISELQKILENYKNAEGDLEVRLYAETRYGEQYDILDREFIDTSIVYDEADLLEEQKNKDLTEQQALDILQEKGLAKAYLDIYYYIK